ncbi:MAG: type II 3-dehydroquinate dehydratase [Rhodospirillaceae bacterium]|jgi:3-dehydroquinate dehydratase II|nr:type II 3-dehydroquinate dehydratase [Rhodospirillaceae bacterium]MBT5374922.1 type II 3-dehydroquinate dehydratase [Rhodospirillaceae bacterium]MBT5658651.1 type II 3-dehydroquinate dehydratase [Rhodospirillaceae bacterium]MBT5752213.1 type II 3-dehydroquinate dehydratase [Rhodospirillaceae bacterium]
MADKILILNGPNLNLLGTREPEIYGSESLADIEALCRKAGKELKLEIDFRQSNIEGEMVDAIQSARGTAAGIIINAGAYSHTSIAILDALLAVELPVIEVHLSNLFQRESFRHHSFVSQAAYGMICGLRGQGYTLALQALSSILDKKKAL